MDEQQGTNGGEGESKVEASVGVAAAKIDLDPAIPSRYAGVSAAETEEGKVMAILSYAINILGIPFFIVPLIMRNNEFSLFHAKQNLMIWIIAVIGSAVGFALSFVCIGLLVFPILWVFLLIVNIMGIINAANLQYKPLPIIGPMAENWFAGIGKAAPPAA